MPFDQTAFNQMLEDYLNDNVELSIVDYSGDTNPIGGAALGVNIDVGETNSFDVRIKNNGSLGIINMAVRIKSHRGRVSGTFTGIVNLAGSQWSTPWTTNWVSRKFNVGPNSTLLLRHEMSGGYLFGYVADEPTGGTDNDRDIETLLEASVAYWQPDLNTLIMKPTDGPSDEYKNFIQRS